MSSLDLPSDGTDPWGDQIRAAFDTLNTEKLEVTSLGTTEARAVLDPLYAVKSEAATDAKIAGIVVAGTTKTALDALYALKSDLASLQYTTPIGVVVPINRPYDRTGGIFNWTPKNMAKWIVAHGLQASGTRKAIITAVGDSTTFGASGKTPFSANAAAGQLQAKCDAALGQITLGGYVNVNDFINASGDSRVVVTGTNGAAINFGYPSAYSFTNGNSVAFTAPLGVDRIGVHLMAYANTGTPVVVQVDGVTVETVTLGTASAVVVKEYTVTTGSAHTISVLGPATNTAWVLGFTSRLTTQLKGITVNRLGAPGQGASVAASAVNGVLSPLQYIPARVGGDLFILQHGINDGWVAGDTTYAANMTALINAYKAVGSVILMTPYPVSASTDPGSGAAGHYRDHVQTLYNLADTLDVPLIDFTDRWNLNYAANTATFGTAIHPTDGGYADAANAMYRACRSFLS